MLRSFFSTLLLTVLSLPTMAAAPQQAEEFLGIPAWAWVLIGVTAFLLITFIVLISLDWRGTNGRDQDD